jgi:hypothetical protein
MEALIGFFMLIALAFGVTHLCGVAVRGIGGLVRIALARRAAELAPAKAGAQATATPAGVAGGETAGTPGGVSSIALAKEDAA